MSTLVKRIKLMGAERFNFDFSTGGLSAYTDESSDQLMRRGVLTGTTISMVTVQEDVKGAKEIKLLNDSITYQAANDCSMTADGDTTIFTDRTITSVKQGFLKQFCQDDLSGFWTRLALKGGAMAENETLIFEEELMNYILDLHSSALESLIWTGDTSGSDLIDGWATQMDADAVIPNGNTAGVTAMSNSNAYAQFLSTARALPTAVRKADDKIIFCGIESFDFLKDDLFAQNLFHVIVASDEEDSFILPATGVKVQRVPGLDGNTGLYAGRSSEFIYGTALDSDAGSVEMWYDKDDDLIKVRNKFYAGVSYPFSNQIVKWTPAVS